MSFIALLHKDHHDKLIKMFDCLTRMEIDEHNLYGKDDDIWVQVFRKYNDPSWIPRLHVSRELNFCQQMNLSLSRDAEKTNPHKVQAVIKNLWGKYKKAVLGWHASGNGKEGKAREGETIILIIRGTTYDL